MLVPAIRALIVDDEPVACELLQWMLNQDPEVKLVGACGDGRAALAAIREKKPDLVFLDVQMPGLDGFAVLSDLKKEEIPYLIFVTAYDSYAVRAFDVQAIDYLLKPFNQRRFRRALNRAKERIQGDLELRPSNQKSPPTELPERRFKERLEIKAEGRIHYLPVTDILWIEAADQYAHVHCAEGSYLIRVTMGWLERYLDPALFVRIHRSIIVSVRQIREAALDREKGPSLILRDGKELKISRRRISSFRKVVHSGQTTR
jgi:two-component system, LytTR family, response regulator